MGFFDKLKKITSNLFSGFTEADEAFFEELEETLIMADLGVDAATDAVEKLRTKVRKEHLQGQEEVRGGPAGDPDGGNGGGGHRPEAGHKAQRLHFHRRQRRGQDHLHR